MSADKNTKPAQSQNSVYKMMFAFSSACHLAQRGDVDGLSRFLSSRPQLVTKSKKGRTLLHIACAKQNYDMVLMLIMRGSDINAKDFTDAKKGNTEGVTPLLLCIQIKEENIGRLLIESGCSLDITNSQGHGILHLCALHGCPRIANLVVDMGINVNQLNKDKDTPLMFALRQGSSASLTVALALVDKNADLHIPDILGMTPLKLAKERGYLGIESAIKYRLEREKTSILSPISTNITTIPENEEINEKIDESKIENTPPITNNNKNIMSKRPTVGIANMVATSVIQVANNTKDKSISGTIANVTSGKRKTKSGRVSETGSVAESVQSAKGKTKTKKEKPLDSITNTNALKDNEKPTDKNAEKRKSKVTKSTEKTPKGQLMCGADRAKIQWFCVVS